MKFFRIFSILFLLCSNYGLFAQSDEIDRWDNWFLLGNKIVFGGQNNFKHSHEIQWRVKNDMHTLDQWYYEGVFTYSPNISWEIVPDFRAAVKPTKVDYRPALGIVHKSYLGKGENKYNTQLVQQLKYQWDIDSRGNSRHGVRLVLTYNKIVTENFIVSGLVGPFYRWSDQFTGIEFVRGGPIFTYIFDKVHTVGVAPLFGAGNLGDDAFGEHQGWAWSFTPMVQIIIRVNKEYKYTPAKYINF
jgi:hypothetical protein